MSGQFVDPVALRNMAREKFIARRTMEEQKFNAWYNSLLKCPQEEVLSKISFDYKGMSLQTLIPELYVEVPNKEVYLEQLKQANEKINSVNEIIDAINREGIKLLEEYNAM